MPNGHLPPPPEIDARDPHAAILTWLSAAVSLVYAGVGELKEEVKGLDLWKGQVDARHLRDDEQEKVRREMRDQRYRWWQSLKVRTEVIGALAGAALGGAGLASLFWGVF